MHAQTSKSPADQTAKREREELVALNKKWASDCGADFEKNIPTSGRYFLTGPADGYYSKVGTAITEVIKDGRRSVDPRLLEIKAVNTKQTSCNLLGLETGHADFALVQSDVTHDAWFAHPPIRSTPARNITLVAPLFVEAVHIVFRPHLTLARLSDLRGRRVWLGTENSLTELTARRILDAAGLTSQDIDALAVCPARIKGCPKTPIRKMPLQDALEALKNLELDAVFQVSAVGFDTIRDALMNDETNGRLVEAELTGKDQCDALRRVRSDDPSLLESELRLFNLDVDLVERLVADGSYIERLIPPDAYCQQAATLTVGVSALLLTSLPSSDSIVGVFASAINQHQRDMEGHLHKEIADLQYKHNDPITGRPSKFPLLRLATPPSLLIRYHPTVATNKIYFSPTREYRRYGLLLAGSLVLAFAFLFYFRRFWGPWFASHAGLVAGLTTPVILWVVISIVLQQYEGTVNEGFKTLSASLLSTLKDLVASLTFGKLGSFGCAPVTQTGQTALDWSSRGFGIACSIILIPAIRSSFSWLWRKITDELGQAGNSPASSANTDTVARHREATSD
jgi:TRAP transporter TAXI family solute receptor